MRKIVKMISIIVATILVLGILFVANSLVGNPISKMLVKNNAEEYINEKYKDLNLNKEVAYDFKFGNYYVKLSSDKVKDLHFTLYYNKRGKLLRDDYENNITDGWNVISRLYGDYEKETNKVFEKLKESSLFSSCDPYHTSSYLISKMEMEDRKSELKDFGGGIDGKSLELDKEYDMNEIGSMGGVIDVAVSFADGNESYERGAEALKEIKRVFDEQNMGFYYINFGIYNSEGNYAYIIEFLPYSEIESDNLEEIIKDNCKINPNK